MVKVLLIVIVLVVIVAVVIVSLRKHKRPVDEGNEAWSFYAKKRYQSRNRFFIIVLWLHCLNDSTVIAAVELDGKIPEQDARAKTDAKKGKALSAAGIDLIHWHARFT